MSEVTDLITKVKILTESCEDIEKCLNTSNLAIRRNGNVTIALSDDEVELLNTVLVNILNIRLNTLEPHKNKLKAIEDLLGHM